MKKGLIQVYTGEGKGKTTAAVGLAVRAKGQGFRICYISFHKKDSKSGELKVFKDLNIDMFAFAPEHPSFCKDSNAEKMIDECGKGLKFIEKILEEKKYDLIIIDEINISLRDGFIKEEDVISLLKKKPAETEVILTGRGAAKGIIEVADLVSEVKNIKHPYDSGTGQRKGIEY
jgi:cob(I)alamin adenosyltransferase